MELHIHEVSNKLDTELENIRKAVNQTAIVLAQLMERITKLEEKKFYSG